jgi:hypothetical protein
MHKLKFRPAIVLAALAIAAVPAAAQGPGGGGPGFMGPGIMMGPGPMSSPFARGAPGFAAMCDPRFAGFAAWRFDRLEKTVRPDEAQRKALDELRAASAKAAETIRTACPAQPPATIPERAAFMEKRAEAMLAAVKTVRPALEAFYNSLSDQQKVQFNNQGPRGWNRGWWQDRDD